jgi:alcohol dehydrogenase
MKLVAQGRLDPTVMATHRFPLESTMEAYDVFSDAASSGALKVVLEGSKISSPQRIADAAVLVAG